MMNNINDRTKQAIDSKKHGNTYSCTLTFGRNVK